MSNLAANLRSIAALQLAFKLGTNWPYYCDPEDYTDGYSWCRQKGWRPGEGKPAKGWG